MDFCIKNLRILNLQIIAEYFWRNEDQQLLPGILLPAFLEQEAERGQIAEERCFVRGRPVT